ncbi:MAG: JAB domain-containing protein [Candidatus Dormibacteraceae bacterium]
MSRCWDRADDGRLLRALLGPASTAILDRPLAELLEAEPDGLAAMGLKARARSRLLAVAEVARRHQPSARPPPAVTAPRHALSHLAGLRGLGSEVLAVLLLDSRMCALGLTRVAEGALSHVTATPREVFTPALRAGASALVMAHNHPSGQAEPSPEDIEFTRVMAEAGRLLDVPVIDHLVVARRAYFSFREGGLM